MQIVIQFKFLQFYVLTTITIGKGILFMEKEKSARTFKDFCAIAEEFSQCMNDYLYVYNIPGDTYYISERALRRFRMPSNIFQDVANTISTFTYPDDIPLLQKDLSEVNSGLKDERNLEYRWLSTNGSPVWINVKGRILKSSDGVARLMIGCINEIGKRQKADNVSGLRGESSLEEHLKLLGPSLMDAMFLRIGIDDFKVINERHGAEYGNYVLRAVAGCIKQCLRPLQSVYRIVSDEFMVLDLSGSDFREMNRLYHDIRSAVDKVISTEQYKAIYTISAGLLSLKDLAPEVAQDYSQTMKFSEFALTEAKNRGKNQLYFFKPEDYNSFLRMRYIRSSLRKSLEENFNGFELFFQPIVVSSDGELFAAETLLRFHTQTGEYVPPLELVSILEESGLIIPVGKWIIRNALAMCKKCREKYPDFVISVNLSYIQLLKSPLYEDIAESLEKAQMPPTCLIVELTESGHLENTPAVQNVWKKLKKLGVSIALDDFGTGYSNLINIGNLRPNIIKIDRSFTVKALRNDYEHELLIHIIKMVHRIGLNLVVEGIETHDELERINELHPDYIQGFYYSKPCPAEEFVQKYVTAETITEF